MKKILSIILAVVLLVGMVPATAIAVDTYFASGAVTAEDGREFNWYIDNENGTLVINGEGEMPEFIEAPQWLLYDFSAIEISEGVTSISSEAFLNASSLGAGDTIILPETLSEIGDRAFYGCSSITAFDYSNVTKIGSMAFYGCKELKEYFIPETVEEIGAYSIGYYCDESADDEFAKIDGIKIYSNVNAPVYNYAVENEIEFIDLSDYTLCFEYEMFDEDSVILTSFTDCEYSTNIIIPEEIDNLKVVGLGEFLFENSKVETVYVPKTVNKIHDTSFMKAHKLSCITVEEGGCFASFEGGLYNSDLTVLYKIPEGAQTVSFPETIAEIGKEAFRNSIIEEITIPDTVTAIGEGAFSYSRLKSVVLPEGVSIIPAWAFASCENLTSVNFSCIAEIGANAFRGCANLSEISFSENLKIIGASSFHGTDINEITIPNDIESIGNKAFGYYSEDDIEFVKNEDFVIKGKSGTVAQIYANENGFEFIDEAPAAPEIFYGYADAVAISIFWYSNIDADYYEIYRKTKTTDYVKIYETKDAKEAHFIDFQVKNGETYTYAVVSVKGVLKSGFESNISVDFIKLSTPEMKSAQMTRKGIQVNWGTVKNAEGYTLYRRTENSGWSQIAEFKGSVKSYLDTTAKSGVVYDYTVKAYLDDIESGFDTQGVSAMYLDIPRLSKISNASNGIKISWKKVAGADSYFIGRKTTNSSWVKIATVGDVSSFTDKTAKSGTTYTYTVVSANGDVSGFYDEKGLTCKFVSMPSVKITNASNGIKLSWGKVSKCSGYIVYRKTKTSEWVRLKKITNASTVTFIDTTAKNSTEYIYAVKAYSGSYMSTYKAVSLVRLSAPKLSSVSSSKSGVTVKWGKVSGASGYYVYRATGNGGWTRIANIKKGSTVSFLDKTAKKGVTYRYTVKAYKGTSYSAHNTKGLTIKDKY